MVLLDPRESAWSGSKVVASRRLPYRGGDTIAPTPWGVIASLVQLHPRTVSEHIRNGDFNRSQQEEPMINEPESPNPDHVTLEYAVDCEDCERIKDLGSAPRTVPLVRSQYSGGLVCEECENERRRADELCDIGDLVSSLRELGWEDVAEFVIRRKLSPADRLFRKLGEFVADELAAQHSTAVRPGVPSVPGGPSLLGRGL